MSYTVSHLTAKQYDEWMQSKEFRFAPSATDAPMSILDQGGDKPLVITVNRPCTIVVSMANKKTLVLETPAQRAHRSRKLARKLKGDRT